MVEVNKSGTAGSVSLIVIGIILILAAIVFYFVKNMNYFAITIIIIGIITLILGLVIIFYVQSHELSKQKKKYISSGKGKELGNVENEIESRTETIPCNQYAPLTHLSVTKGGFSELIPYQKS